MNDPEFSVKKYLGNDKSERFDISYTKTTNISQRSTTKSMLDRNLNSFLKKTVYSDSENESDNFIEHNEYIKILEIRKNEHFGDALMFLNERCPLIAKVRTSTADLLILRKMEAFEIYSIYPNIWKRINKKSLYNMEQKYIKIQKH